MRRNVFGDHARHEYMKSLYRAISRLEEVAAKNKPMEQERPPLHELRNSSEKRITLSQHIVREQTAGLQCSMTEWSASLCKSDDDEEDDTNQEINRGADRSLLSPVLSTANSLARHLEGDKSSSVPSLASSSATSTSSSQNWNKSKSGASLSASCGSSTSKRSKKKANRRRKKTRRKKKKSAKANGEEEDGVWQSSSLPLASVDSTKCSRFKKTDKSQPSLSLQDSWKDQKPDALAIFFQKQEKAALSVRSCESVSTADETPCHSYVSLHCRRVTEDDGDKASTESQTQDHQEFVPSPSEKRSIERQFSAMIELSGKDSDDEDKASIFSSIVSRQENHVLKDLSSDHGIDFPTALGKGILHEEEVLKHKRSSIAEDLDDGMPLEFETTFRVEEERLLQSLCLEHEIEFPCSPRFATPRD